MRPGAPVLLKPAKSFKLIDSTLRIGHSFDNVLDIVVKLKSMNLCSKAGSLEVPVVQENVK